MVSGSLAYYELHISINGSMNTTMILGNDTIIPGDNATYALNYTFTMPRASTVQ